MSLIILLAVFGFLFIFLEFFLPGMIFAILGALLLIASISQFFFCYGILWGVIYLLSVLLLCIGVCKIALSWIQRHKAKDHFYLNNHQEGYLASQFDPSFIGKEGIAFTELKPSGHILVEGKQQQALCESGYIPKGAAIQVVGGKGGHLLIKQKE
jgi:membrane-bound ClpP family serine protease